MDTSHLRKIGFVVHKENDTVDVSICDQPLAQTEIIEFRKKAKVIFDLRPAFIAFNSLELNHNDIATIPSAPKSKDMQSAYLEGMNVISIATQKIGNLLASASSYLTITEQKINSLYGADSIESHTWNNMRNDLHADNFSYRFSYDLRNYSQHYGLPISSIKLDQKNLLTSLPIREVKVELKNETLLKSNYKWKWGLREEIEKQTEPINVIELCNQYMHHLRTLHQALFDITNQKIADLECFLDSLFNSYGIPPKAFPVIFVYQDHDDINRPSPQQEFFPTVEIKQLQSQKILNQKKLDSR